MHGRDTKLGSYVPLLSFNKLMSWIFKKISFFWIVMFYSRKCAKMPKLSKRVYIFAHKIEKLFFLKSLTRKSNYATKFGAMHGFIKYVPM